MNTQTLNKNVLIET